MNYDGIECRVHARLLYTFPCRHLAGRKQLCARTPRLRQQVLFHRTTVYPTNGTSPYLDGVLLTTIHPTRFSIISRTLSTKSIRQLP